MAKNKRGSGRTSNAMNQAPENAVYVWCDRHLDYPKRLARHLGRSDLQIVRPEWIVNERWRGQMFSGIIVDHAFWRSSSWNDNFHESLKIARMNIHKKNKQ